jgi:hypothetical protein
MKVDDAYASTWEEVSDNRVYLAACFCKVSFCIQMISATMPYKWTVFVLLT